MVIIHPGTVVQCVDGNYSDVPFENLHLLNLGGPVAGDVIHTETSGI